MAETPEPGADPQPTPADHTVTTQHRLRLGKTELRYTATVGTVVLKEETEREGHKAKAEVFFLAFTKDGIRRRDKRPITFSFNGGPGSSSVWMLLGLLGPRRVPMGDPETAELAPPFHLKDNEHTLLVESDLVFIDPVGTGYSRPLSGKESDPNEFFTFQRDLDSVGG